MLRGTCYYNKKIKVENVAESAKIVTNVHTFRGLCPSSVECSLTNIPLIKGTVPKRPRRGRERVHDRERPGSSQNQATLSTEIKFF